MDRDRSLPNSIIAVVLRTSITMTSSNDSDPFDTMSLAETDASSDFELIDVEHDDARSFAPSSTGSDAASTTSDVETQPPSPQLHASRFHFPDPVSSFEGQELPLDTSSLYTLLDPSQHSDRPTGSEGSHQDIELHDSRDDPQQDAFPRIDDHDIEKMDVLLPIAEKQAGPSQPRRRMATMAPKAAWIVTVLAAVLLGLKSTTLLGLPQRLPSSLVGNAVEFPAQLLSLGSIDARTAKASVQSASCLALAPSPSPSALTVAEPKQAKGAAQSKVDAVTKEPTDKPRRSRSVAVQDISTKSKGLSVVDHSSASPSKPQGATRPSKRPAKDGKRGKSAAAAGQLAFNTPSDLPVFPPLSKSSHLNNATTTSWEYWLAELDSYYQIVLRPALLAAKQQAYEAARLARRYNQERVWPAFASLRKEARDTARPALSLLRQQTAQTAQRTARYHDEVIVPALAQLRSQAADAARTTSDELTRAAKRPAEYREEVIVPALKLYRIQAMEGAKITAEGLQKAAKMFAEEAAGTVQQVKKSTGFDLEALGLNEYLGFWICTVRSWKATLRTAEAVMLAV